MGAILDVDLSSRSHRTRELTQDMADRWLGGTGLGAHLLWEEQTYLADPLGPDNVMVWAPGPFAGTAVPLSNRFGVCARSPLTGVWGEAECGGHWANDLKKAGFDALIVRGRAEQPVYVWIQDGQVEFRDATHLWGKDTFEVHDTIRAEVGSAGRRGQEHRGDRLRGPRDLRVAVLVQPGAREGEEQRPLLVGEADVRRRRAREPLLRRAGGRLPAEPLAEQPGGPDGDRGAQGVPVGKVPVRR